eukprot:scaffold108307_cov12-Tisochrysis_lutea.AAC.1
MATAAAACSAAGSSLNGRGGSEGWGVGRAAPVSGARGCGGGRSAGHDSSPSRPPNQPPLPDWPMRCKW